MNRNRPNTISYLLARSLYLLPVFLINTNLALACRKTASEVNKPCDKSSYNEIHKDISNNPSFDKSSYSIFNKTPKNLMRDFATDRPDKTESAYTLDAGHIMHETDIINYTYNQDDGVRTDSFFIFAPNFKIGLTNNTDIQFVYQPYIYEKEKVITSKRSHTKDGSGDLVIRLKTSLWGNDNGDTAMAIMPYVKAPIGKRELGNDSVEGGLIAPLAISITENTGIGLMTQVDFLRNDTDTDYYAQFVNTATVSTSLIGELSGSVSYTHLTLPTKA